MGESPAAGADMGPKGTDMGAQGAVIYWKLQDLM